ncbi:MAG: hypothetical protein ACPGQD_07050, partial [Planctomycetota bacterium]
MEPALMAGAMAEKAADGGSKDDPPYPGESPTDAEFDEWLKKFQNQLRGTDYAAMLADEIPASLIGFSANVDTSDLHEQLAVAGETVAEARARQMHNHKVKSAKRDEQARKDAYDAGMKKLKNGLAGRISGMMTAGHALGVLSSLKIQFKMGSDTDGVPQYDGYKMFKDIIGTRAAKSAPSKRREGQWHEREYQKMLAEPLPDHCVVAEYSKKIVKLREQLMPFFRTVKLEKETLSEVFVQLMPACNQGEGRTLEREMTAKGTWSDPEKVLRECITIVMGSADTDIEDARRSAAALPAGAAREAAMAAAAALVPGMAATSQGWKRFREAMGGPRAPAPAPATPPPTTAAAAAEAQRKAAENAAALAAARGWTLEAGAKIPQRPQPQSGPIEITAETWATLDDLAARTYVPK